MDCGILFDQQQEPWLSARRPFLKSVAGEPAARLTERNKMRFFPISALILLPLSIMAQAKPQDIPRAELPKQAPCVVCTITGFMPGDLVPVAGVRYKGKAYYFCQKEEVATFKKDPEAFVDPVLPRPMPSFELSDLSKKKWDSSAFKGKFILIDFGASWCAPCKELAPELDKLYSAYKAQGLELLSVDTMDKKADFDKFVKPMAADHPVLFDDKKLNESWHVVGVPAVFLVKNGNIVAQWLGVVKPEAVESAVKAALGG
jgi:thiol-disulfide isomerase/thioredoxin